jgi:hypothetical protein
VPGATPCFVGRVTGAAYTQYTRTPSINPSQFRPISTTYRSHDNVLTYHISIRVTLSPYAIDHTLLPKCTAPHKLIKHTLSPTFQMHRCWDKCIRGAGGEILVRCRYDYPRPRTDGDDAIVSAGCKHPDTGRWAYHCTHEEDDWLSPYALLFRSRLSTLTLFNPYARMPSFTIILVCP